jgi:lipid A 4'-phosphatase
VKGIYHLTPWIGRLIFAIALVVVLTSIFFQAKVSRRQWRRSSALVAVVIIGVGFFVHSVLKDGMGRPRPRDIQAYAGVAHYMPVFQPSSFCQTNCSFVSGHAAVGFSLMAFGMFGIRKRRQFWMLTALATGTLIGFARIAQGGHFLSDIVFSYLAIWISYLAIRSVWMRFRVWQLRTPLPDVLEVSQR